MSKHTPIDPPDTPTSKNRFKITNPEGQPGLTNVIERGLIPIAYINWYILDHLVPCAFCDQHQPHLRGFTAQMADGRTALCGRVCGRHYFGDDAARRLEQTLAQLEEQAHKDELLAQVMDGLPAVMEAVDRWAALESSIVSVLIHLPIVAFSKVRNSLYNGTDFVFFRAEQETFQRPDGLMGTRQKKIETGRVREIKMIWAMHGHLRDARNLCSMISIGANSKGRKASIEERLEMRENLIRTLKEAVSWFNMAQIFLEPDNLSRYCRLHRELGDRDVKIEVKAMRTGMAFRVRYDEWLNYSLPDLSAIPSEEELLRPLRRSADD